MELKVEGCSRWRTKQLLLDSVTYLVWGFFFCIIQVSCYLVPSCYQVRDPDSWGSLWEDEQICSGD